MLEDGQQAQTDHQCTCHISLRVPYVTGCGRFQEEQAEEDQDLGNNPCLVRNCVKPECFEAGNEEKYNNESVVEAERKMDENSIGKVVCSVMNFE